MTERFFASFSFAINELTLSAQMPTMFGFREYVESGGLISYGPNTREMFRRAADYVDEILRGANAADMPTHDCHRLFEKQHIQSRAPSAHRVA